MLSYVDNSGELFVIFEYCEVCSSFVYKTAYDFMQEWKA